MQIYFSNQLNGLVRTTYNRRITNTTMKLHVAHFLRLDDISVLNYVNKFTCMGAQNKRERSCKHFQVKGKHFQLVLHCRDLTNIADISHHLPKFSWHSQQPKANVRFSFLSNSFQLTPLDVVEKDVSNSSALLLIPILKEAGAKNSDELPTKSPEIRRVNNTVSARSIQKIFREPTWCVLMGKAIMGKTTPFKIFMFCNNVALFSSIGILIVLVSVIHFHRKTMMKLLVVTHKIMWASASFMEAAYIAAAFVITRKGKGSNWMLVTVVSIGTGSLLSVSMGLGVILVQHWLRKWEWRREREKRKEIPNCSVSSQLRNTRKLRCSHSTNSDVDSSESHGFIVY
ncbi:hypothetical protein MKX03_006636 [Papaver bracteatum]|nr:hypothetical protein MKX03_006636 [Papaver bracteatum]